ncbi:MAG: aspartate-semialdehyde dehydrogenase [Coriobacteriia bacterium]|nr:aspartate-semialdehyde dehydrogenase [Coriobacteriia bacterium]
MYVAKPMPKNPVVAIAGITGAVGQEMLDVLTQLNFPASKVIALASARSAGKRIPYAGPGAPADGELVVQELTEDSFEGVDIALFSAGGSISEHFEKAVVASGAVMIDNTSAFRMRDDVPLVVPEVNADDITWHKGVIANPNCTTIQMVVALNPIYQLAPIKRVVVSTYQSSSGAGAEGMKELYDQTRDYLNGKEELTVEAFAHQIAFNCIPQIDVFMDDGSTKEEWKMVVETKKIMHAPDIEVAPFCVRIPILRSHSESIHVEFDTDKLDAEGRAYPTLDEVRNALENAPGLVVIDNPEKQEYPMPYPVSGTNETYVGRLRRDPSVKSGVAFWCVADQLRKGAALNAVQIAQALLP